MNVLYIFLVFLLQIENLRCEAPRNGTWRYGDAVVKIWNKLSRRVNLPCPLSEFIPNLMDDLEMIEWVSLDDRGERIKWRLSRKLRESSDGYRTYKTRVRNPRSPLNMLINETGDLEIGESRSFFAGKYYCILKFSRYETLTSIPVHLLNPVMRGKISLSKTSDPAVVGHLLRFQCKAISFPTPIYTLKKNDVEILSNRLIQLPNGVFHLHNLTQSDTGTYKCEVHNPKMPGPNISNSLHVEVIENSSAESFDNHLPFQITRKNLHVKSGETVVMECLANGQRYQTSSIAFQKKVSNVSSTWVNIVENDNVFLTGDRILNILNATSEYSGSYRCVRELYVHNPVVYTTFLVKIVLPPATLRISSSKEKFRNSEEIVLTCSPEKQENFEDNIPITWTRNGQIIASSTRTSRTNIHGFMISQLRIIDTVTSDQGIYQCSRKSVAGFTMAWINVLLDDEPKVPRPPKHLKLKLSKSGDIKLTWKFGKRACNHLSKEFNITFSYDGNSVSSVVTMNSVLLNVGFDKPYTVSIRGRFVNRTQFSDPSKLFNFTLPSTSNYIVQSSLTDKSRETTKILYFNVVNEPLKERQSGAKLIIEMLILNDGYFEEIYSGYFDDLMMNNNYHFTCKIKHLDPSKTYGIRAISATSKVSIYRETPFCVFGEPVDFLEYPVRINQSVGNYKFKYCPNSVSRQSLNINQMTHRRNRVNFQFSTSDNYEYNDKYLNMPSNYLTDEAFRLPVVRCLRNVGF